MRDVANQDHACRGRTHTESGWVVVGNQEERDSCSQLLEVLLNLRCQLRRFLVEVREFGVNVAQSLLEVEVLVFLGRGDANVAARRGLQSAAWIAARFTSCASPGTAWRSALGKRSCNQTTCL